MEEFDRVAVENFVLSCNDMLSGKFLDIDRKLASVMTAITKSDDILTFLYMNFMPEEAILGMYRAIWPGAGDLLQCLCVFNAPFTLVKGLLSGIVVFFLYKPLTPVFRGQLR